MLSDLIRLVFYYAFGVILVFVFAVVLNRQMQKFHRERGKDQESD